jgi:hypothetical protein
MPTVFVGEDALSRWVRAKLWGTTVLVAASVPLGVVTFQAAGRADTPASICGGSVTSCDVTITTALNAGMRVGIEAGGTSAGGRAVITPGTGDAPASQVWKVTYGTDGRFTVANKGSGLCLDSGSVSNSALTQQPCSGTAGQSFKTIPTTTDAFVLNAVLQGSQCWDVMNGSANDGAAIGVWSCGGATNQQFVFHLQTASITPPRRSTSPRRVRCRPPRRRTSTTPRSRPSRRSARR